MSAVERVLERLEGVKRAGASWKARCPSHEDVNPSLSIKEGDDAKVLLHCHAGCTVPDIVAALGLEERDLFGNGTQPEPMTLLYSRGLRKETIRHFEIEAVAAAGAWKFPVGTRGHFKFKAFEPGPNGAKFWWGENGKPKPAGEVYNLKDCEGSDEAWLLEGEPDVWIGWQAGLKAFSFTGGCGVVPRAGVKLVAAANIGIVHICYDLDQPGRKGALKAEAALSAAGVDCDIRRLPDELLGEGGDVTTYYQALDKNDDAFRAAMAELPEFIPSDISLEPSSRVSSRVSWPEPLAADAFHGLVGEVVEALRPHTEADDAALVFQLLTMFGSAAGRHSYYAVEGDKHFPNLFMALVGETAKGRKGSSYSRVSRLFDVDGDMWFQQNVVQGLSSGEGLIWGVRDPIIVTVALKSKGKSTGEYDTYESDPGVTDKRLLAVESELGGVLQRMGRDGNTLSAVTRSAWDSGNLRVLTKTSPARATGAHISIIGHITRDELRAGLDDIGRANGWANRFLWVCTRRSGSLPFGGNPAPETIQGLTQGLRAALIHAGEPRAVEIVGEARDLWIAEYPELSEGRPGLLGAITSRAEAQVVRLALIYALLDLKEGIEIEHLQAALSVWRYADASAQYVFGDALGDPIADTILGELRRRESMTRTEISHLFGRNQTKHRLSLALDALLNAGAVVSVSQNTGGRPAELWKAR